MPVWRLAPPDAWPTLGWLAIDWIEEYLRHGPGDVQGEPIVLDDEWCQILLDLYRLFPSGHRLAGRRAVRRGVVCRAKGRAKSELAGMVVCFDSLGPSRFAGWDAGGDAVGRPVLAPFARCLATEEEQSGNTYDNVRVMLEGIAEHHADAYKVDPGLTRSFLAGGGEIVPSSSASASKDGGKETLAVFDEPHLYVTPELKRMHRTVSRNLAKRKMGEPWALETTTMFAPAESSILETTFEYCEKLTPAKALEAGIYLNHREGLEVKDWADDEQVRRSLVEAYGPAAEWTDFDQKLRDIRDPEASEADSRRYWLNQRTKTSSTWMDPAHWKRRRKPETSMARRDRITIGFHGAQSRVATAIEGCRISDGHLFRIGLWERPTVGGEGWETDLRSEVDATIAEAIGRYDVVRAYIDPAMWQDELIRWKQDWGDDRILSWWTNRPTAMARALERLHTAVVTPDGVVSHDADPDVTAHITNARGYANRSGTLIRQPVAGGARQIVGAIACALAFEARADAIAAETPKNEPATARANQEPDDSMFRPRSRLRL